MVAVRSRDLDIRAFEVAPPERIFSDLVARITALIAEVNALLGGILDEVTPPGGDELPDAAWGGEGAAEPAAATTPGAATAALEEIAFIARIELRQREQRLQRLAPGQDLATVLSECDSALRRVRKALEAVDRAIAHAAALPRLLDAAHDCETALAVRRAYAKFAAGVRPDEAPTSVTLRARLRLAGTRVAMFVGWSTYPHLRVQDRLLLCRLQHRILDWLRTPGAADLEGIRLWSDFAACVAMFRQINRRPELVAHDLEVLTRIGEAQRAGEPAARWRSLLERLEGLDPELDRLLRDGEAADAGTLARVIARLARELGVVLQERYAG